MKVLNENLSEGKDEFTTPNVQSSLNTSQINHNGQFLVLNQISDVYFVNLIFYFIIISIFFLKLESRIIVDVEKNKSQSQEIRTLAKFEFSVKNIILELFKGGPDKVIY